MRKWDNFWLGLLFGLLLPAAFCYIYARTISLDQMLAQGMYELLKPIIGRTLMLGTFANMGVMFILYQMNVWKFAKGVLIAIVPYLAAGIILLD